MPNTPMLSPPIGFSVERSSAATAAPPVGETLKPLSSRLVSLDAYRGVAMLLMASEGLWIGRYVHEHFASGVWSQLAFQTDHVQWRGCALWDMIQPSFTFIVGVAMPFSLAKRRSMGQTFGRLTFHAVIRSLILICLGVFLRSMESSMTNFTFEDTLTQIGLGYTFAFMLAWAKPRWQAAATAAILVGCWGAFALWPLPAPDAFASVGVTPHWYAEHGLRGFSSLAPFPAHWDKNTNIAAAFDHWFLNRFPRPEPFQFNRGGYLTLSFVPTLATMLLGLLAGELMFSRVGNGKKVLGLVLGGMAAVALGVALDQLGVCPIVKRIWTPSWVLFSGGIASVTLALFFALIDLGGMRVLAFPAVVVGMNSIAMYCMADGGFADLIHRSFEIHGVRWLITHLCGAYWPIAEMSLTLLLLWLVLLWMHRRRVFIRI